MSGHGHGHGRLSDLGTSSELVLHDLGSKNEFANPLARSLEGFNRGGLIAFAALS